MWPRPSACLLEWYERVGRKLPWRETTDPYAILVSEMMLQQTQVDRVLPKYREFLERFPTLTALAEAPTAEVIRAWAPLGYNMRAVRLQAIARQVVAEYHGTDSGQRGGTAQAEGRGPLYGRGDRLLCASAAGGDRRYEYSARAASPLRWH